MTLGVMCFLKHVFLDCFYTKKVGPKPKQIGTLDYCRLCGCFVYRNSTGQFTAVIVSGRQDLPADVNAFSLTSFEA